tara:strand:+ start:523 stop:657 length:135 start_codon:yes stop_codon:yes gene_type:complete
MVIAAIKEANKSETNMLKTNVIGSNENIISNIFSRTFEFWEKYL